MSISEIAPLFTDPQADAIGSVLAFLTVVLASAGGVGGGGLLVPLYMLVLDLGEHAIPLSKATIFGASLANAAIRLRQRHPTADRPLSAHCPARTRAWVHGCMGAWVHGCMDAMGPTRVCR